MKCTLKDISEFYEKYPEFKNKIKVKTRFGFFKIQEAGITAYNSDVIEVVLENNLKIYTSPKHRIIKNGNWEYVENLKIQDEILTENGYFKIKKIKKLKNKENLYDIQVEKVKEYIGNGVVSHNSTLQEALFYALFGKPFAKVKLGSLINSINQKNLEVQIEFKRSGKDYKIIRGIKPNIFEIYENGELIKEMANVKDYQEFLETKILKFNELTYRQLVSIIANLSTSKNFVDLSSKEKEALLENVLDVSIFSELNKILKEVLKDYETKLKFLENDLSNKKLLLNSEKDKIKRLKEEAEKFKKTKDEQINYFKNEIELLKTKNNEIKEFLLQNKSIKEELLNIKNIKTNLEKQLSYLQKQYNMIVSELKYISKAKNDFVTCKKCGTKNYISIDEEKLDTEEELKNHYKELQKSIQDAKDKLEKANLKFQEIQKKIVEIKKEKENFDKNSDKMIYFQNKIKEIENYKVQEINEDILKELEDEIAKLSKEKETLLVDKSNYFKLAEMIFKSNIKEELIKMQIKDLNIFIEYFLNKFELNYKINIQENLKVQVSGIDKSSEFYSLSNGEKTRVNFALLFAFLKLIEEKNGIKLNILFLDEALDSSLDYTGREKLLEIIQEFSEQKDIIIISHSQDIIEKEIFNRVFEVKKEKFSKIIKIL